jgi:hypothetical protein
MVVPLFPCPLFCHQPTLIGVVSIAHHATPVRMRDMILSVPLPHTRAESFPERHEPLPSGDTPIHHATLQKAAVTGGPAAPSHTHDARSAQYDSALPPPNPSILLPSPSPHLLPPTTFPVISKTLYFARGCSTSGKLLLL